MLTMRLWFAEPDLVYYDNDDDRFVDTPCITLAYHFWPPR